MSKQIIFMLLLVALGLMHCVDPVEFDAQDAENILVVDGWISESVDTHYLRLSRSGPLDKRVYAAEPNAQVTIFAEDGTSANYQEIEDGLYMLPPQNFVGEIGGSYYIDITLTDGQRYRSRPEIIPEPVYMDPMSFTVGIEEYTSNNGGVLRRTFVEASVNLTLPEIDKGPFLRWTVNDIYVVTEKKCDPRQNIKDCYIYPPNVAPDINLFSGTNFAAGSAYSQAIAQRGIDFAFGQQYSISAFQFNHTKAAMDYWTKINQVSAQSGSIFDVQPAPIEGNIYNLEDDDELVFGYFSAVTLDTAHVFITSDDVADVKPVTPYCGPEELAWWLAPEGCCNCLRLANSYLERPDFWD